jgi:phosphoribosylformylglycinamidine (FGAM) synthase-like enzyme
LESNRGVIVSNGFNPSYGDLDSYWMTASAIDEALRNLVAVGGNLKHTAILDNFCWGDPDDSEELAALVRAAQACYDIAKGFGVPFISGKDSLNNTWRDRGGKLRSIPRSLLISAIGVIDDITHVVSMDLKQPGDWLYLIGETREELGGAHLWKVLNEPSRGVVPHVNVNRARETFELLYQSINKGYIRACHDLSEGGLAVAAAEMAFAGPWGVDLDLAHVWTSGGVLSPAAMLFSETPSRFIVEVPSVARQGFENLMRGFISPLGRVTRTKKMVVRDSASKRQLLSVPIAELQDAWEGR